MKILFDRRITLLRHHFPELCVHRSAATGWEQLANSGLIRRVGLDACDVIVTTDQDMRHHQNVVELRPGIMELIAIVWSRIRHQTEANCVATMDVQPVHVHEVPIPSEVM